MANSDTGKPGGASVRLKGSGPSANAGRWVAWTPDGNKVVASSTTLGAVRRKAALAGYPGAIVERIPRGMQVVTCPPKD